MEHNDSEFCIMLWTAPKEEEAVNLIKLLLNQHLIACATLLRKAQSFYFWEGSLCESCEIQVIMKTCRGCFEAIAKLIHREGSYKNPELIGLPAEWSSAPYREWIHKTIEIPHAL